MQLCMLLEMGVLTSKHLQLWKMFANLEWISGKQIHVKIA